MEAIAILQTATLAYKNIFFFNLVRMSHSGLVALFLSIEFYHSCAMLTFHLMCFRFLNNSNIRFSN
jgi:hypothetical protein